MQRHSLYFSHRLWIFRVLTLDCIQNEFFLFENQVFSVMIQGIVVSIKKFENLMVFTLDDSTGLIDCKYFYSEFEKPNLSLGDNLRITGKICRYLNEISIKLTNGPYFIENFDEDIEWAVSVDKLWRSVYCVKTNLEVFEFIDENVKSNNSKNFWELVQDIRDLEKAEISYQELIEMCEKDNEIIVKLMQQGFLIQKDEKKMLEFCEFLIYNEPFMPKEFLVKLFDDSYEPVSIETIKMINGGRFANDQDYLLTCLNELMAENVVYEVSDNLYAKIPHE